MLTLHFINKKTCRLPGQRFSSSPVWFWWIVCAWIFQRQHTHTHTHTRLTALFPGRPWWAGTRKVKPIWILLKQETVSGSSISWAICKSAPCSRQITTPAPHHSVFLQAGCPSCRPTNSVKSLKAMRWERNIKQLVELVQTWQLQFFSTHNAIATNKQRQISAQDGYADCILKATKCWCKWGAAAMHTSAPTQWRSKYLRFSAWCHNRFSPATLSFFSWLHPELKRNILHTTTLDYDIQCQGKLARHVLEKGHLVEKLSRHTYCTDCLTWTTKVVDTSCHRDIIFNNLQWEIKYVAANGRKEYQFLILRLSSWFSVQ